MTYNREAYLKYRANRKKKYTVCQLLGCQKPLERTFQEGKRVMKFCCPEHAKDNARQIQRNWQLLHPEKLAITQKKYRDKQRAERKALKLKQQYEDKKNQTNKL